MPTKIWKPPKLQSMSLGNVERHATWNELFYDLAFVVVISVIALDFSHNFNIAGMFKFLVLFVPVYILWISQTFYSDRFDTDDLSHQLGTLIQMIGIAGLAIFAQDALDTGFIGFVISYMIVRGIIIINNIRAGVHNPEVRDLTYGNARGFILALIFWFFSLVLPAPFNFYSAGLGLIIDFITPYTKFRSWTRGAKGEEGLFLADISHLTERSGLFLIIVLGETIVAVVNSVTTSESSVAIPAGIIAMFIAFCIWWIFFDVNERGKDYQQDFIRNQNNIDNKKWGYFQGIFQINSTMIFAIIIIWMAVSFEHIIDKHDGVGLSTLESWIFFWINSNFCL